MDRMTAMGVFVEVAERGSLSAAADTLNISRAMVTRHLAELEDWLGARLFRRTTRRINLTSAGEQALERCRRLLELSEDLKAAVGDSVDAPPRGQVRIACSASFGQSQLAVAVADYVARFPRVRVDLLMADRTINLVEERIDLAIRITHELDPMLIARRLSVCRSLLCATPAYLAARGTPQRPEELLRHSCLPQAGADAGALVFGLPWQTFRRSAGVGSGAPVTVTEHAFGGECALWGSAVVRLNFAFQFHAVARKVACRLRLLPTPRRSQGSNPPSVASA
jgi:DNA-binding transcriptional LysR family regulator